MSRRDKSLRYMYKVKYTFDMLGDGTSIKRIGRKRFSPETGSLCHFNQSVIDIDWQIPMRTQRESHDIERVYFELFLSFHERQDLTNRLRLK